MTDSEAEAFWTLHAKVESGEALSGAEFCAFIDIWMRHPRQKLEKWLVPVALFVEHWRETGFNSFFVADDLGIQLRFTESNSPLPRVPYPAFSIELPPGALPATLVRGVSATSWCERILVDYDDERDLFVMILWACGKHSHTVGSLRSVLLDGSASHVSNNGDEESVRSLSVDEDTASRTAQRLVRNVLAWVTHRPAVKMPRNPAYTKRAKELAKVQPVGWSVTSDIELDPLIREFALGGSNRDAKLWSLTSRFIVRGHWRNQACGPNRAERRIQWIQPFWKGPNEGVQLRHNYHLGKGE